MVHATGYCNIMMVSHDNDDRDVHDGDDDLLVLVVHGSARQAWRENNIKMQNQMMPSEHREQMMFHILKYKYK